MPIRANIGWLDQASIRLSSGEEVNRTLITPGCASLSVDDNESADSNAATNATSLGRSEDPLFLAVTNRMKVHNKIRLQTRFP